MVTARPSLQGAGWRHFVDFGIECHVHLVLLYGEWWSDVVYRYHEVSPASRLVLPPTMHAARPPGSQDWGFSTL